MQEKSDFELKSYYESILGRDISNTTWWRVKQILKAQHLEVESNTLKTLAHIKKQCKKTVFTPIAFTAIYNKVTDLVQKKPVYSGKDIDFIIRNRLQINPHRSTIFRWFQDNLQEGFSLKKSYRSADLLPVFLSAYIYQFEREHRRLKGKQKRPRLQVH